ncbi:hypothetical protein KPL78_12715 [Roseomonas sp. HJA6]|uniref:Lysozyme inhibitor LprI N-terminal domain-containing protein n=1 Tax=Roseomonas alba TaxID=2846776 RepID=A0ABS7A8T0_9PROT|nr:hypothetical protein [Neoroseomonas alba]MBW6398718.1 hypothetical protein [Neoroseomonas alba]
MPRHAAAVLGLLLGLAACEEDFTETKPPEHDGNRSLSRAELRWCMFNDIRIEAARADMRTAKQGQVQAFNAAAAEWNASCRRYRHARSDRDSIQRQVDARRQLLENEGRARFAIAEVP